MIQQTPRPTQKSDECCTFCVCANFSPCALGAWSIRSRLSGRQHSITASACSGVWPAPSPDSASHAIPRLPFGTAPASALMSWQRRALQRTILHVARLRCFEAAPATASDLSPAPEAAVLSESGMLAYQTPGWQVMGGPGGGCPRPGGQAPPAACGVRHHGPPLG